MDSSLIQLTRKELNELILSSLNDILTNHLDKVIDINLLKIRNEVCLSFESVPLYYKSSISIIGVNTFERPITNVDNCGTGINMLEYFKLLTSETGKTYSQQTSINVAQHISKIAPAHSKFIVMRFPLYDGIQMIFNFMKEFSTTMKYGIIFKIYKNEKEGQSYSQNGLILSLIKDTDGFYFIDIDNSIYRKVNLDNIPFNELYPSEQYKFIDIIYTLRESFNEQRPSEFFQSRTNIVTDTIIQPTPTFTQPTFTQPTPTFTQPTFAQPTPTFTQPTFTQPTPTFTQPTFTQPTPTFTQPTFAQTTPTFTQPTFAQTTPTFTQTTFTQPTPTFTQPTFTQPTPTFTQPTFAQTTPTQQPVFQVPQTFQPFKFSAQPALTQPLSQSIFTSPTQVSSQPFQAQAFQTPTPTQQPAFQVPQTFQPFKFSSQPTYGFGFNK